VYVNLKYSNPGLRREHSHTYTLLFVISLGHLVYTVTKYRKLQLHNNHFCFRR